MLTGSCRCLRRSNGLLETTVAAAAAVVATAANTTATSTSLAAGEPLLFLYPRWFSSCQRRRYHHHHQQQPFGTSVNATDAPAPGSAEASPPQNHFLTPPSTQAEPFLTALAPARLARVEPVTDEEIKTRKTQDQEMWGEAIRQLLAMAKNHVAQTATTTTTTTTFAMASDAAGQGGGGDDDVTVLDVPEAVLVGLTGDVGETKFVINRLSGCLVHVLPKAGPNTVDGEGDEDGYDEEGCYRGMSRKVALSGSKMSRRTTAQMLGAMAEKRKLKYGACTEELRRKIRLVFETGPNLRDNSTPGSAPLVPLPERWTYRSLAQYVEVLTELDVPHFAHRVLYDDGERHTHVVRNILCQIINDPKCKPYLSTRTINMIIRYLDRNGFFPELRIVMAEVKSLMTTRSFNALLRTASVKRDLRLLCNTIDDMRECGAPPNGLTWVTLLDAVRDRTIHSAMLNVMYDLELLRKPYILQCAVPFIVKHDFPGFVSRHGSMREFASAMDAKFGCGVWFSAHAAREMIYVAKQQKNTEVIYEILRACKRGNIRLPTWPLNQILLHMLDARGLSAGVDFYCKASKELGLERNSDTMDILFHNAWRQKAPNTCRVIWWYSCLEGTGSFSMRRTVFQSMLHNSDPGISSSSTTTSTTGDDVTPRDYWESLAGKLIVNVGSRPVALAPDSTREIIAFTDSITFIQPLSPQLRLPASSSSTSISKAYTDTIPTPFKYLFPYTPRGPLRNQQHIIADAIIDTDIRSTSTLRPDAPFRDKLLAAVAMDVGGPQGCGFMEEMLSSINFSANATGASMSVSMSAAARAWFWEHAITIPTMRRGEWEA